MQRIPPGNAESFWKLSESFRHFFHPTGCLADVRHIIVSPRIIAPSVGVRECRNALHGKQCAVITIVAVSQLA